MARTLSISCIFTWTIICLVQGYAFGQWSSQGGSLVITSSAREGLIIVADKRSIETHGKDSTFAETTKIYPLNDYYAFTVAGKLSIHTGGLFPASFESVKLIRSFLESNRQPVVSLSLLEDLGNYLFDNFQPVLEKMHMQRWLSNSCGTIETKLVDITICGYDVKTNMYQFGILSVGYTDTYNLDTGFDCALNLSYESYSDMYKAFRASSQISIAGKTDLAAKLILTQNEVMQKFITNKAKINFSSFEIITFSKWLIEETSKVDKTVGDGVDVAIIDEKGFHWLAEN
ncbi:MAG TPA: hypothetical protein VGK59_22445 [Ohtaekwangia sp.]